MLDGLFDKPKFFHGFVVSDNGSTGAVELIEIFQASPTERQ
jgi:hypothetical protein